MSTKPTIGLRVGEDTDSDNYVRAIVDAGAEPAIIPDFQKEKEAETVVQTISGLIIPGGDFAFPTDWYVENEHSPFEQSKRLASDIAMIKAALDENIPVLGICAGMQILAALRGCKITGHLNTKINHLKTTHAITIEKNSLLHQCVGVETYEVTSSHVEAVVEISSEVHVSALAPDGTIEAIEIPDKRFALGVQWHPERGITPYDKQLFNAFVAAF